MPVAVRLTSGAFALAMPKSVGHDQQVARLDVAVHDPGPVGGVQRAGRLGDDVKHDVRVEPAVPFEDLRQGLAVDQFHDEVGAAERAVLTVVEDPGDARVREGGGVARLGPEPGAELLVARVHRGQHLDRDRPTENLVAAPPDLTHATSGDPLDQRIAVVKNIVGHCH
jgi:hypothetical protein